MMAGEVVLMGMFVWTTVPDGGFGTGAIMIYERMVERHPLACFSAATPAVIPEFLA
jgi:hypothetical protein